MHQLLNDQPSTIQTLARCPAVMRPNEAPPFIGQAILDEAATMIDTSSRL